MRRTSARCAATAPPADLTAADKAHRPARSVRPRARARAAVLLAALVAVGTSSCSLLPFGAGSGPSTQTLADGSVFLVDAPTNFQLQAIVSGRLALIEDNCVGLEMPGFEENAALAFPSDDGRAIVLPDGLAITLGDSITGGGGYFTLSEAPTSTPTGGRPRHAPPDAATRTGTPTGGARPPAQTP